MQCFVLNTSIVLYTEFSLKRLRVKLTYTDFPTNSYHDFQRYSLKNLALPGAAVHTYNPSHSRG